MIANLPSARSDPTSALTASTPAPTSDIPHPTSLTVLTPDNRARLTLLFRTRGDAVSFAALREEDPLETLVWLTQPHIKPWHELIQAAHRDHEQTETRLALARALKDITRILDLEADSTLRIRAVNAIIRLANAIHRANRDTNRATDFASETSESPSPSMAKSVRTTRRAAEFRRAQDNAETAAIALKFNLDRRALREDALQDAKAPRGTPPTPLPDPQINRLGSLDRTVDTPPIALLAPARPGAHLNGKHKNAAHSTITARAGTPHPPPRQRRKHRR